eukprot:scaffold45445_cov64-Phaeocystis_antarctica.AAC.3
MRERLCALNTTVTRKRARHAVLAHRAPRHRLRPRSARAHRENSAPRHRRRRYAAKAKQRPAPPPSTALRATAAKRFAPPPPTAHRRRYAAKTAYRATAAHRASHAQDLGPPPPHPVTVLHCCRGAGVDAARAARHDWPALTREPSTAHGALAHRAGRAHTARKRAGGPGSRWRDGAPRPRR